MSSPFLAIGSVSANLANAEFKVKRHYAEIQRRYAELSGIYFNLCQSDTPANKLKLLTTWYADFLEIKRLRDRLAAELKILVRLLNTTSAKGDYQQTVKNYQRFLDQLDRLNSNILSKPHTFEARWITQPEKKGHQRRQQIQADILEVQGWSLNELEDFYNDQRAQLERQYSAQARSPAFEARLLLKHRFPELEQRLRLLQEHYLLRIYAKTYEDYTQELVKKFIPLFYHQRGRVLNSQINKLSYLLDPLYHTEEALVQALTKPQTLATPAYKQEISQLLKQELKLLTELRAFTVDAMRRKDGFVKAEAAGKKRTLAQRLKVVVPLSPGPLRDLVHQDKVDLLQLIDAHIVYIQQLQDQLKPWLSTNSDPIVSIDYLFTGAATQLDLCRKNVQQFEQLLTDFKQKRPSQLPKALLQNILDLHRAAVTRTNQLAVGFNEMTSIGNHVNDCVTQHHLLSSCKNYGAEYKQIAKRCEVQLLDIFIVNLEAIANQIECLSLIGTEEKADYVCNIEMAIDRLQVMLTMATTRLEQRENYRPKETLQQLAALQEMVRQVAGFSTQPPRLNDLFTQLISLKRNLIIQELAVVPAESSEIITVNVDTPIYASAKVKGTLFTKSSKADEKSELADVLHERCAMTFG